ncbi:MULTISPECIES: calcium-binding protein [Rhizobium]|uniref:Calcium-binding protein n=1 Tax=Rhizobium leguminosarum bv. viciae TaxID=387 RepID=A0A8G2IUW8_RHILV|nr:calcium-binding protein [Rhizobium leguminosarum]NKK10413.1 calcium-binding protein [Rhizobium leguminosarum bv. viciae]NKK23567.1 calcium-binding protein [Rhizobium leguminosarum bv. viciae]TBX88019.1 calcium-binding protein [Rhizobium leguminosarum bv. viciae]TBY77942.1 calcium-binding protein [Rhizobium leguminosarum bv. viciae]TBZ13191.1 calcium-binding protein [Rhizobium leguminosarum bv. viciae]
MKIERTDNSPFIFGSDDNDIIDGSNFNDWIKAGGGDDLIRADDGHDRIEAGRGHDIVRAGNGSDTIFGGGDDDLLFSDTTYARRAIPHSGESDDRLDGGSGKDILVAGDGADLLHGGEDGDAFVFRFHDPMVGTTHCYTTVMDFKPEQDRFVLDADRFGKGDLPGANFINHSRGFPGEFVDTFYRGVAEKAHGEHVVVITDRGFTSSSAAATAIHGEARGDIIVYHDEKTLGQDGQTHGATLAYVDSANHAHAFAHVDNLHDMSDLTSLTAENFGFI